METAPANKVDNGYRAPKAACCMETIPNNKAVCAVSCQVEKVKRRKEETLSCQHDRDAKVQVARTAYLVHWDLTQDLVGKDHAVRGDALRCLGNLIEETRGGI